MFHACAVRFDVMNNLEFFGFLGELNKVYIEYMRKTMAHSLRVLVLRLLDPSL
jgi:hypothetical protein